MKTETCVFSQLECLGRDTPRGGKTGIEFEVTLASMKGKHNSFLVEYAPADKDPCFRHVYVNNPLKNSIFRWQAHACTCTSCMCSQVSLL